jgi:hypothetical protein
VGVVPPGVVTVMFTMPVPAGLTTVISLSELTTKEGAGLGPKSTTVAPVKPAPWSVTVVPPESSPAGGDGGAWNVGTGAM